MILAANEVDQSVEISGWYVITWRDCKIGWNPKDYANITDTLVTEISSIWLPDLTWWQRIPKVSAFDYNSGIFEGSRAHIYNNGTVLVDRQILLYSYCSFSLKMFPFDIQQCNITFTSWNYMVHDLVLTTKTPWADLSAYKETGMWTILSVPSFVYNKSYPSGTYQELTFMLVIQREPLFYVFYLMIPGFLLSFLGSFVHMLPPESQQKHVFSMSILVSLTVFLNIMVSHTAPKSEIPLLSIYFFVLLATSVASSCAGVFIEAVYHTDPSKTMPRLIRAVLLDGLAKRSFFSAGRTSEDFSLAHQASTIHRFLRYAHAQQVVSTPDAEVEAEAEAEADSGTFEEPDATHAERHRGEMTSSFVTHKEECDDASCRSGEHGSASGDTVSDWWKVAFAVDRLMFIVQLAFTCAVMLAFLTWALYFYAVSPTEAQSTFINQWD